MKKSFVLLLCILSCTIVRSQADSSVTVTYKTDLRFSWNYNMYFNLEDFFLGMGLGVEEQKNNFGARVYFDLRPYFKKIQIKEEANVYSQYHEQKYFISIELEKRFLPLTMGKSDINFFAALKNGWIWGNYRGLDKSPGSFYGISPSAGICFVKKSAYYRLGYSYLNMHSEAIPANRIVLSMTIFGGGKYAE